MLANSSPDDLELAYGFVECARLKEKHAGELKIQFDATDRDLVRESPCRVYADEITNFDELAQLPLSDLVSVLVLQENGLVVPLQYGFSRAYAIGDLTQGSFRDHAARWKRETYPSFRLLCRNVFDRMIEKDKLELPFTNWYSLIMQSSSLPLR